MVKLLTDCCLHYIAFNITACHDLVDILTPHQKEILIKRMSSHQQFTVNQIKSIENNLFSPKLRRLELHNTSLIHDGVLKKLAQVNCLFEYVSISECKEVTDEGLVTLLKGQPNLYYLKLKKLPQVTGWCLSLLHSLKLRKLVLKNLINLKDLYVVQVISNCPTISWLELQFCRELTDACVMAATAVLKAKLNILKVSGVSKITDQSLESLVKNCPNLKELKVYGCNKLSQESIDEVLCELNLTSIDISYTCGYGSEIASFKPKLFSDSLQKFIGCGVQIPEKVLIDLADNCQMLTCLELCGVDAVNDRSIKNVMIMIGSQLKGVDLSYCRNLTDEGIDYIMKDCKELETLSLQYYTGACKPLRMLSLRENVKQAQCLRRLYLSGCKNFDSPILSMILPCLSSLEALNFAAMRGLTDEQLILVSSHCPLVKNINLKGCKMVTDVGVCSLVQHLELVDVILSGVNSLTDKTIFMMASSISTSLETLYISGCQLVSPHVLQYLKDVSVKGLFVQHRTPGVPYTQIMARNLDTGEFCRADLS